MRKSEKYIYLILGLLLGGFLAGGIIFAISNNKDKTPEVKVEEKVDQKEEEKIISDGVKLKDVKNVEDKILQTFEVSLNGKIKEFNIVYSYQTGPVGNRNACYDLVIGEANGVELYNHSSEYEADTFKICGINESKKSENFTISKIEEAFDTKQFEIIKGTDNKNYLIVYNVVDYPVYGHRARVYNEDLELISNNAIKDSYGEEEQKSYFTTDYKYDGEIFTADMYSYAIDKKDISWFNDSKCSNNCEATFKVEDNKIYYLSLNLTNKIGEQSGYIEERIYTINNNKLEYETLNKYNVSSWKE